MNETALREKAQALAGWTADVFHRLHQIPEIGDSEFETSALIKATLDEIGVPYTFENTWVIATIEGATPGKTVAIRADMDALPLEEKTCLPYASAHPGRMHACGHDAHTAILLGTAKLLWDVKGELPGTARLLFQPAEETTGGAARMIAAGAMKGVDAVYGLHVAAQAPTGRIGCKAGPMYAACDELFIDILGKKGHGAHPASGVDAIVIAAQVITALQTLVTRETEATDSVIVTIGSIHGGTTNNILCDEVRLHGTLRTLTPEKREQFLRRIPELCDGIARAMGGGTRINIRNGYCACVNDEKEAGRVLTVAERLFGQENLKVLNCSSMGAEDMAYFLREAPGAMYHLGSGSDAPGHNELFRVDDACLPTGILMHAALVFDYLTDNR